MTSTNNSASEFRITTTEMHTGGEAVRILETGVPPITGKTILDKRRAMRTQYDHIRRLLMHEPRGHFDMYGVVQVKPNLPEADMAVLFLHNEGYSTMCGHAVIALGRYAVDNRLIPEERITSPEIQVNIECPCGLVIAYVEYNDGQTGRVKFHSVPSFAFALDVKVDVPDYGQLVVDIGYGGAFYAIISAQKVGLDVTKSRTVDLIDAATKISEAVRDTVQLNHPDSKDLSFLYGTVLTDGQDKFDVDNPTNNTCVFADREVDRSPTGSGVSARVAVQHARGQIVPGQVRTFRSGVNGSEFTGEVYKTTTCGSVKDSNQRDAVVVRVSGKANYTGTSCFTLESDDMYQQGFLPR